MIKKRLFLLLICFVAIVFGQVKTHQITFSGSNNFQYAKSIDYEEKRAFEEDLKEKYADKDFTYTEEEEEEKEEPSPINTAFLEAFVLFMTKIFPFILGGIIIFIILKTFLGMDVHFWNFKKSKNKIAEKLVYQDEDIHETDIEGLLQNALNNKAYRLAIRYYYLSVLKTLSNQKLIEYHKDKTNSEYLFEIEDTATRTAFAYLSYVYSYVWYGDFPIDETNFKLAEKKYQSFKNDLK